MNNTLYKKLLKNCDKILIKLGQRKYIYYLSSIFVTKYNINNKSNVFFKERLFNFIRSIKSYIFYIIHENNSYYSKSSIFNKKYDIIFISNKISQNKKEFYKDQYFGKIREKLLKKKLEILIIYRNFTSTSSKYLFGRFNLKKNEILLSKTESVYKELIFFIIAIKEFLIIRFIIFFGIIKFDKNFISYLSLSKFLSICSNLRQVNQIKEIIKKCNPRSVVITWEGHAWERALISELKKEIKLNTAGYQFTPVNNSHNSMFKIYKKYYNPDYILTSGKILTNYFIKKKFKKEKILTLGSVKYKNYKIKKLSPKKKIILVCPEGLISETEIMLKKISVVSKNNPDYQFIFRFHPIMTKVEIKKILKKNKIKFNKKIQISFDELKNDIKKSNYVCYRNSAVVFEAAKAGLIPIYLDIRNEVNVNPLFFDRTIFYSINEFSNLNLVMKKNINFKNLNNINNNYFSKPNYDVFKKILKIKN